MKVAKAREKNCEQSQKQLEFLQQVYQTLPCAIVQCTNDDAVKIINANAAACTIHGYMEMDSFLADMQRIGGIFNSIYPPDRKRMKEIIRLVRQTAQQQDYELRILQPNGMLRWIRGVLVITTGEDGASVLQNTYMDDTERVRTAAREHWQDERFKILVEAMRTVIFDYDQFKDIMNYSVTLTNNTVEDLVVEDYLKNLNDSKVIERPFIEELRQRLRAASKYVTRDSYECKADFFGQGFRWVKIYYTSIADPGGNIYRIVGRVDDIQDRKVAQECYQEELKIRANMSKDLIASLRINITQDVVEKTQASFSRGEIVKEGMNREQVIKSVAQGLLDDVERKKFADFFEAEAMKKAFATGNKDYATNFRTIGSDGTISWLEANVKFLEHPVNKDIIAFVAIRDINDKIMRSSVIELLMGSEYDYIAIVNVNNGHFKLLAANPNEKAIPPTKGENYDYIVEKYAEMYLPKEERGGAISALSLDTVYRQLEEKGKYVYYCSCHEGINIRYKKNEYRYMDKAHKLIMTNRTDVTSTVKEEKQRNMRLRNALLGEKQANLAKSIFLSRMSHDIRTPLNAIIGVTSLALEEINHPQKVEDYLNKASAASKLLLGLVNDILDMSKIENKAIELHPSRYEYSEFVGNINTIISPLCQQKNIEFIFTTGISCAPLWVDKVRFNQIFLNFLSNAVKFTPEGGTVEFYIKDLKRGNDIIFCEYSIIDNGIGMSKEFQKHMFEPFAQEYCEKMSTIQGTGLGMPIAKSLVELMGGTIEVTSELGKGTKVNIRFELELAPDKVPELKDQKEQDTKDALQGKKVLLVEDHPINAEIAEKLLTRKGVIVTCAENGKIAVDRFIGYEEGFFDAVLMDVRMPVMDGLEATHIIRSLDRADAQKIPIIAMTANAFDEDRDATLQAGMVAHIAKPISPKELYSTLINNILV
ncbi:MAG: ATP-binding protein [Acidaminococcaceae bacterium]|nr:ATP-binding protein [Acidaminococcaceae bacterium]